MSHVAQAVSILVCSICEEYVTQQNHPDGTIGWLHVQSVRGCRSRALSDAIDAIHPWSTPRMVDAIEALRLVP